MTRHANRILPGLVLAFGLAVAGAASSDDGNSATERQLVIDPGSFAPITSTGTAESVERRAPGLARTGPRIMLRQPEDDSVFRSDQPVTVHVEFLPAADGSAPDMATLKVRVRRGFFGMDITKVVQSYVRGASILVPKVDFSGHSGNFRFEIEIRDYRNRESEVEFRVTVGA